MDTDGPGIRDVVQIDDPDVMQLGDFVQVVVVCDNLAVKAAITSEQLKHTMGIDVPALLNKIGGDKPSTAPILLPARRPSCSRSRSWPICIERCDTSSRFG